MSRTSHWSYPDSSLAAASGLPPRLHGDGLELGSCVQCGQRIASQCSICYHITNEIVLNERTGSAARGELAARTTYQRAAKGAIAVSECPPDGKRVRLENTGRKVQLTCILIYFSLCMFMLCHIICGYLLIIFRRVFAMMSSLRVLSVVDAI